MRTRTGWLRNVRYWPVTISSSLLRSDSPVLFDAVACSSSEMRSEMRSETRPMAQVLIIDDDPAQLHVREAVLREAGFSVFTTSTAEAALELLRDPAIT